MVGVPRSKGCRLCVQRRVRCDQTRPICNNCKKGNRPCPGYGNDMKFQDEGPKLRKRYQKQKTSHDSSDEEEMSSEPSNQSWEVTISSSRTSREPSHPFETPVFAPQVPNGWDMSSFDPESQSNPNTTFDQNFEIVEDPGTELPEGFLRQFTRSASGDPVPTQCPSMIAASEANSFDNNPFWLQTFRSPQMEQIQLLAAFTDIMTPLGNTVAPALRFHGRWLSRLPHMLENQALLDTAIRAVTLAYLGIRSHSEDVKREATPYYGKALRLLNTALLDDTQGMTSETLSATILLSFYEMFSSDKDDAWVRHAGGAGTLMRIRGPERHRYGFDREIFLAYRHTIIIESFEQDKACFLDEPGWRAVAADIHEDIRHSGVVGADDCFFDLSEEFFREMAGVPALCCDARHLPELARIGGGTFLDIRADVKRRALEHRMNMKSIMARFSAALRINGDHTTSKMVPDSVIPIRYSYSNIFIASSHSGYRTILMIINGILCELDPTNKSFYAMENRGVALECCRSIDFMETSSFLGPFFAIFALRLSWAWLEQREEKLWVVNRLRIIGEKTMSFAKGGMLMRQSDAGAQAVPMPRVRQAMEDLAFLEEGEDRKAAMRKWGMVDT